MAAMKSGENFLYALQKVAICKEMTNNNVDLKFSELD